LLVQRVLAAAVLIPVAIGCVVAGGLWLTVPAVVFALLSLRELDTAFRTYETEINPWIAYPACAALIAASYCTTVPEASRMFLTPARFGHFLLGFILVLVMLTLGHAVWRYHWNQEAEVLKSTAATVFVPLYLGATFAFMPLTRGLDEVSLTVIGLPHFQLAFGAGILLLVLFCTWASDTAAFAIGKSFGRRKLTPVSPSKTVEGLAAGLVASAVAAAIVGPFVGMPAHLTIPVGAMTGVLGVLGDLSASVVKRGLKLKDFGTLIPGHGGVLDRFDSLMYSMPAAFICALLLG
jgi:phosphatidate cytidylyltransferase